MKKDLEYREAENNEVWRRYTQHFDSATIDTIMFEKWVIYLKNSASSQSYNVARKFPILEFFVYLDAAWGLQVDHKC